MRVSDSSSSKLASVVSPIPRYTHASLGRCSVMMSVLVLLQLELSGRLRAGGRERAGGKLQHRVRAQAQRHAALPHAGTNLENLALLIQEHHVDRELHTKRVDTFCGHNPQALAGSESGVLEQSGAALGAGVGDRRAIRQRAAASEVSAAKFHVTHRFFESTLDGF